MCAILDIFKIVIYLDNIKKIVRIIFFLRCQLVIVEFNLKIARQIVQFYYILIVFFDKARIKIEFFNIHFVIRIVVAINTINLNIDILNIDKIIQ